MFLFSIFVTIIRRLPPDNISYYSRSTEKECIRLERLTVLTTCGNRCICLMYANFQTKGIIVDLFFYLRSLKNKNSAELLAESSAGGRGSKHQYVEVPF